MGELSVLEICAGAGGQSLGLEMAGFEHVAAIEIDGDACTTLASNRPGWNVVQADVRSAHGRDYRGVTLLAGGIPCPPFSIAGKQLGSGDERDLFPDALRLVREAEPIAVMIENVKGFASERFAAYRRHVMDELMRLGYDPTWRLLNACDHGVPQLRPRFVLVAIRPPFSIHFEWPARVSQPPTVGEVLLDLMREAGWPGAPLWACRANRIAPTIVGGSKKHGGPDLGPTRARAGWASLGVNGRGVADNAPDQTFPRDGLPKLTIRMVARLQGFPDNWAFSGGKTAAYRQVGNAFPPPVARAVGESIARALGAGHARTAVRGQFQLTKPVVSGVV